MTDNQNSMRQLSQAEIDAVLGAAWNFDAAFANWSAYSNYEEVTTHGEPPYWDKESDGGTGWGYWINHATREKCFPEDFTSG